MRGKILSIGLRLGLAILSLILFTGIASGGDKVLYQFDRGLGAHPSASLIWDGAGNLYGTTSCTMVIYPDTCVGYGLVYELTPTEGGGWSEKVLYGFGEWLDGFQPIGGLTWDAAGNLYGTNRCSPAENGCGCGTVYELMPGPGGSWTEQILHQFGYGGDGCQSRASLVLDAEGNVYGTTATGGAYGQGTVFELIPAANGNWTEKVLHSFGQGTDGQFSTSSLIWDAAGNLYGTTAWGGAYGMGLVFELSPGESGSWTYHRLHNFGSSRDGANPYAGLIFDRDGNLYGATYGGGIHSYGTVFEMTPNGSGGWKEKVLHSFNHNGTDGYYPQAGVIIDAAGNLYGVTSEGGVDDDGLVFELSPNGSGGWTYTKLHNFWGGGDGLYPQAALIFDAAGNVYGTTSGGNYYDGTVFEVTPGR
jgi:uncharacterized repeat protein (TIGR03803 family)